MGLFSKNETCCICNQNEGNKKLADGYICSQCLMKCGNFNFAFTKSISKNKIEKAIHANTINNELLSKFSRTKKFEKYFEIDENNRLWRTQQLSNNIIFTYDDVIKYELLQDGEAITKGGLGRAVVGGALFGGVGAVVGAATGSKKTKQEISEFRIKIITRHEIYNEVYINFLLTGKVKSNSILFKSYQNIAQTILSAFVIITDSVKAESATPNISSADEIKKYKELLDMGAITQEEFDTKKQALLNL